MVTVVFNLLSLASAKYIDEMDSREAWRCVSLLALLCDEFHHVCKVFGCCGHIHAVSRASLAIVAAGMTELGVKLLTKILENIRATALCE